MAANILFSVEYGMFFEQKTFFSNPMKKNLLTDDTKILSNP